MRHLLLALIGALISAWPCHSLAVDGPDWWTSGDPSQHVIDTTKPANNSSPATIGQACWMASRCYDEFNNVLPNGPGFEFSVSHLTNEALDNYFYSPINLGQLKALAKPFYDRLHSISPYFVAANFNENDLPILATYPWGGTASNHSIATIGQVKAVFAIWFELDTDQDGMLDLLEYYYFGNLAQGPSGDYDSDGVDNATELVNWTDPADANSGGSGGSPGGFSMTALVRSSPRHASTRPVPYPPTSWADLQMTSQQAGLANYSVPFPPRCWTSPNTLVLIKNDLEKVWLTIDGIQQGMKVKVRTFRDPADNAGLGTTNLSYGHIMNNSIGFVNTDQTGSHLIVVFDDQDNDNYPDPGESAIVLPMICIEVALESDSVTLPIAAWANKHEEDLPVYRFGFGNYPDRSTNEVYDPGEHSAGIHLEAEVILKGGGGDGRRGMNRVFGGWLNNSLGESVKGNYDQGSLASVVFAENFIDDATDSPQLGPIFLPSDPDPVPLDMPLLDASGWFPEDGGRITFSPEWATASWDLTLGQKRRFTTIDCPSDRFPETHQGYKTISGEPNLLSDGYAIMGFRAYLVFWTNTQAGRGFDGGGPGRRTYQCIQQVSWAVSLAFNIPEPGDAPELNFNSGSSTSYIFLDDPVEVEKLNGEVRPPNATTHLAQDYSE